MALVRYEPIDLFDRFNHEINRFLTGRTIQGETSQPRSWVPAVDIREDETHFFLYADIPGVQSGEVDITLEDGVLTIKGERRAETGTQPDGFRRRERVHGSFMRQFTLPDTVNDENISATVRDGVLQIEIPKQDKPQARRITIS